MQPNLSLSETFGPPSISYETFGLTRTVTVLMTIDVRWP